MEKSCMIAQTILLTTFSLLLRQTGGNAKTLMFVNISPADYNADETVTSLT